MRKALVKNKWIAAGIIVVVVLPFLFLNELGIISYLDSHSFYFRKLWEDPLQFVAHKLKFHLIDWSALFLNSPAPKIDFVGTPAFRNNIYLIAGILTFGWIVYLMFRRKGSIPISILVYLICYIGVILNWPLFEPRLWVPAVPLFIALILQQSKREDKLSRFVLPIYLVVYILVGIAAIGYYTYTSFNKKALSVKQDAGIWKKEYEIHFFGKPLSDTAIAAREPILNILKKYD